MKFPDLSKKRCVSFWACGNILAEDRKTLKTVDALTNHHTMTTRLPGKATALISIPGRANNPHASPRHLHVDVAIKEFLVGSTPPKVNTTSKAISGFLDRFIDYRIGVKISAQFEVPVRKLPSSGLVRSSMIQTTDGKISINQVAGIFTIKGAAATEIGWFLCGKKQEKVGIEIEMDAIMTITKDYLVDVLNQAYSVLTDFVLSEGGNENSTIA